MHETLRDRARAMAQMRAIWHCEIFDITPAAAKHRSRKVFGVCRTAHISESDERSRYSVTCTVLMMWLSIDDDDDDDDACSVCNTVKCALAMWLSIPLFHNPVTLLGTLGSVIVVFGVLLYNKARDYERHIRQMSSLHRLSISTDVLEI